MSTNGPLGPPNQSRIKKNPKGMRSWGSNCCPTAGVRGMGLPSGTIQLSWKMVVLYWTVVQCSDRCALQLNSIWIKFVKVPAALEIYLTLEAERTIESTICQTINGLVANCHADRCFLLCN
jgi:hypothetical protein